MNISCCPSRGMTGGIMYAEDVCRYAYTKTPNSPLEQRMASDTQSPATRCCSIATSSVSLITSAAKTSALLCSCVSCACLV